MAETSASKLAKRIHTDGSTHYKSATAPANPVEGDLWYDTSAGSFKYFALFMLCLRQHRGSGLQA